MAAAPGELRHVLVTGGAGYIGSSVVELLLRAGYRVRVLDKLVYGDDAIRGLLDHPALELVVGDFRNVGTVVTATRDVDAVIHLGAIVGDPACALDEELTVEVNLSATKLLAEVARARGVRRFLFASTCSVYGASPEILDETSRLNPVSIYAATKLAAERILVAMADETFAPIRVRFGTIFGLSARKRFDLVVNLLSAKAVTEGRITVFGGNQWRPFVHVRDAAAAVFRLLEAPADVVENRVFNIGSDGQNHTIDEIGELIRQAVPDAEVVRTEGDGNATDYRVTCARIRDAIGFEPEWSLRAGIEQVLSEVRDGTIPDWRDPKYNNARFLRDVAPDALVRQAGWLDEVLVDKTTPLDE